MRITKLMAGLAGGAALMYLLDPEQGRRRRALLRDQLVKLSNNAVDQVEGFAEMTADRAKGLAAEATRPYSEDVPDEVLVARVRSAMGHYVEHPRSIDVSVWNGAVKLSGTIPTHELDALMATVRGVDGVRSIDNALLITETEPDSQGG